MRIWHLGKDSRRQEELTFWKSVVMLNLMIQSFHASRHLACCCCCCR
jgi:hypothetical protein